MQPSWTPCASGQSPQHTDRRAPSGILTHPLRPCPSVANGRQPRSVVFGSAEPVPVAACRTTPSWRRWRTRSTNTPSRPCPSRTWTRCGCKGVQRVGTSVRSSSSSSIWRHHGSGLRGFEILSACQRAARSRASVVLTKARKQMHSSHSGPDPCRSDIPERAGQRCLDAAKRTVEAAPDLHCHFDGRRNTGARVIEVDSSRPKIVLLDPRRDQATVR